MSRNPRNRMGMEPPRYQHQQRPALSPWEGGFAPGSNTSGGGGLLPTPPSLLSQLSSPEAQLAVASNLLTSLLRPVQNSMHSSGQVPSLMSLGTSGGNLGSFGGMQQQQQPPYRDNYSRGSQYNDNPPSHSQRRSFDNHHNRSPVRSNASNKRPQHNNRGRQGRGSSPSHKPRSASSSDQQRDSKRDVQAFKKDKDSTFKEPNEKRGAAYEGLPKAAFHCHLCKKNMWDAVSFDNHVKGVAHQRMIEEREKSYQVKSDLLRHDAKLEEQQKQIEMERLVRLGKKPAPSRREYCKMCDFAFFGDLGAHRKSKIHQTLKNFLHPKCNACQKEFALRIEQDRHLLSADHLKKVFKVKKPEEETKTEAVAVKDEIKKEVEEEKEVDAADANTEEDVEMTEVQDEGGAETKEEEPESESATDVTEESPEAPFPMSYNPDVSVGQDFLMPVTGMFCKACRRFFLHEDQALTSHCRTLGHYNNCLALSNQKQKVNGDEKNAEEKQEASSTSGKRPQPDETITEPQDAKRSKSEELYDPLGESPPTPELTKFETNDDEANTDNSKQEEAIDKDLADLIEEFEDKSVPQKTVDNQAGRARRGRSFRGRGRGRM